MPIRIVIAGGIDPHVAIGEVDGEIVPLHAGAQGQSRTAVGGHHEVGMVLIDHRGLVPETGTQAPPVQRLVFHTGIEIPAVAPVLVADGLGTIIHIDVQGVVGGPAGPDSANFEAQIVQRLVGNAQGQRVGQLHGTMGITVIKLVGDAGEMTIIFGFAINIGRDLGLVGQTHRPLIVQTGVQAKMTAYAPAAALDFNIILGNQPSHHGRILLFRGQVDIHDLQTGGHGEDVVDLPGQSGHGGDGLQVDAVQVVTAGPVLVIAVAQTKAREHAQPQPQAVVELPAGVRVRRGPHGGLGSGLLLAVGRIQRQGPHGRDKAHTAHDLDAGQLGDAGRVIGNGRHVVGAAHHAAGQTQTA